jgi:hypothetical protein
MATVVKKCSCPDQRRCRHSWVVPYRAGGRQRERSFRHDQKSVANDFALKVEHDKKAGVFIGPKLGDLTVFDWCDRWVRQHQGAHNSRRTYETVLSKHIMPVIGDLALRRVTREHIQDLLLETMPKTVGHAVIVSAKTLLVASLSDHLDQVLLTAGSNAYAERIRAHRPDRGHRPDAHLRRTASADDPG